MTDELETKLRQALTDRAAQITDEDLTREPSVVQPHESRWRWVAVAGAAAAVVAVTVLSVQYASRSPESVPAVGQLPPATTTETLVTLEASGGPTGLPSQDNFLPDNNSTDPADILQRMPGFVDYADDSTPDHLVFLWHGPITTEAAAQVAIAAGRGTQISLRPTSFSEADLITYGRALRDELQQVGIPLESYGPNSDYSGLLVSGPGLMESAELQEQVRANAKNLNPALTVTFREPRGPMIPFGGAPQPGITPITTDLTVTNGLTLGPPQPGSTWDLSYDATTQLLTEASGRVKNWLSQSNDVTLFFGSVVNDPNISTNVIYLRMANGPTCLAGGYAGQKETPAPVPCTIGVLMDASTREVISEMEGVS